ncbi:MAG: A/G-specific adenine glycosylase [Alphaproteobacteria bacterium]
MPKQNKAFHAALLEWYASHGRKLPWRATQNPYPIWLAEVMLQQTTVAAVIPYYHRFLEQFPTLESLAAAPLEDVYHLWQGLGYYSRARNLHAGAQQIGQNFGGVWPEEEEKLLSIKGIGPYTAAAIRSFAFNQPAVVVDGNVERVISRLFRVEDALPAAKPAVKKLAASINCAEQPRTYGNAIMELGATICTPKNPSCTACPVAAFCACANLPDAASYPRKTRKKKSPVHHAIAWVVADAHGHIYLRQRPATGLLANLWEVPHTGWETIPMPFTPPADWQERAHIKHVFTHLTLHVEVRFGKIPTLHPAANAFANNALPPLSTLMKKALLESDTGNTVKNRV